MVIGFLDNVPGIAISMTATPPDRLRFRARSSGLGIRAARFTQEKLAGTK